MNKEVKIVCTIGPKTESVDVLKKLISAGMNIARLNFSHGDFDEHKAKLLNIRKASEELGTDIDITQDLGGPKIRTGEFGTESGRVVVEVGQDFIFTTKSIIGDNTKVSINYFDLPKEIKIGHFIMVDDGKKRFEVTKIEGDEIYTRVIAGGELKGRRGVNLPNTDLSIPSLTEKDIKDLEFGLEHKVDFFALSFVRRPEDVSLLRNILKEKNSDAKIISKIETPQALENLDEIIDLSDAIMVARGDLAVEIPFEEVPFAQKKIIKKSNEKNKFVITATQMLESMIKSPVPTRAEVSDITNAILDGTDAVMLSEETTLGDFPVEAVEVMKKIILRSYKNK